MHYAIEWAQMPLCTHHTNVSVGFEVLTTVAMKDAIFWDVMQCTSCENQCFGGICRLPFSE
jgi:hypothetical protein